MNYSEKEKYKEEWNEFSESPKEVINKIIERVKYATEKVVNRWIGMVEYSFSYGFVVAIPCVFISLLTAPEINALTLVFSLIFGVPSGVVLAAMYYGWFVHPSGPFA